MATRMSCPNCRAMTSGTSFACSSCGFLLINGGPKAKAPRPALPASFAGRLSHVIFGPDPGPDSGDTAPKSATAQGKSEKEKSSSFFTNLQSAVSEIQTTAIDLRSAVLETVGEASHALGVESLLPIKKDDSEDIPEEEQMPEDPEVYIENLSFESQLWSRRCEEQNLALEKAMQELRESEALLIAQEQEISTARRWMQPVEESVADLRRQIGLIERRNLFKSLRKDPRSSSAFCIQRWYKKQKKKKDWRRMVGEAMRSDKTVSGRERARLVSGYLAEEREYVLGLRGLVFGYLRPFQLASEAKVPVVTAESVRAIFGECEALLYAHEVFLAELELRWAKWPNVGWGGLTPPFFRIATVLEAYGAQAGPTFVEKAQAQLEKLSTQSGFAHLVKECEQSALSRGISLEDAVLLPCQRIPELFFFLRKLHELTDLEDTERDAIAQANLNVQLCAIHLFEQGKVVVSERDRVLALEARLVTQGPSGGASARGCPLVLRPSCRIIREGLVFDMSRRRMLATLTDSFLLVTLPQNSEKKLELLQPCALFYLHCSVIQKLDATGAGEGELYGFQVAQGVPPAGPLGVDLETSISLFCRSETELLSWMSDLWAAAYGVNMAAPPATDSKSEAGREEEEEDTIASEIDADRAKESQESQERAGEIAGEDATRLAKFQPEPPVAVLGGDLESDDGRNSQAATEPFPRRLSVALSDFSDSGVTRGGVRGGHGGTKKTNSNRASMSSRFEQVLSAPPVSWREIELLPGVYARQWARGAAPEIVKSTVDGLIAYLASIKSEGDDDTIETVLVTAPLFISPRDLAEGLSRQLVGVDATTRRRRILRVIELWCRSLPADFIGDLADNGERGSGVGSRVRDILLAIASDADLNELSGTEALDLEDSLQKLRKKKISPKPSIPLKGLPNLFRLRYLANENASAVAKQLTLLHHKMFVQISREDIIHKIFAGKIVGDEKVDSGIDDMITHGSLLQKWIIASLLRTPQLSERAKHLASLISLIQQLQRLGNFFAVVEMIRALSSGPIQRLRQTFAKLAPEEQRAFVAMKKLLTEGVYNNELAGASPPAVPHIATLLESIARLHPSVGSTRRVGAPVAAKSAYESKGIYNIEMLRSLAVTLKLSVKFQRTNYVFPEDTEIQGLLNFSRSGGMPEAQMNELSLRLEPDSSDTDFPSTDSQAGSDLISAGNSQSFDSHAADGEMSKQEKFKFRAAQMRAQRVAARSLAVPEET